MMERARNLSAATDSHDRHRARPGVVVCGVPGHQSRALRDALIDANSFRPKAWVERSWHPAVFSSPIWRNAVHRRCKGFARHQDRAATQACQFYCSCGTGPAELRATVNLLSAPRTLTIGGEGQEFLPLVAF